MAQIQAGQFNADRAFNLDGLDYNKGLYEVYYRGKQLLPDGSIDLNNILVGIISTTNRSDFLQSPIPVGSWKDGNGDAYTSASVLINDLIGFTSGFNSGGGSGTGATNKVLITQDNHQSEFSNIDPNKEYFIDEPIILSQSIDLDTDITIRSYGTAIPRITAGGSFPIFTTSSGDGGNIFIYNLAFDNSASGSTVFDIVGSSGFETIQLIDVNFVNSEGIGTLDNYRQLFYSTVAYIGGKPSLTLTNSIGGVRITGFNGINLSDSMTEPVFKAGSNLNIMSTFDLDGKIDLGSTAALTDFSDINIQNDESLIFINTTVSRNSIIDETDTTITPNITSSNVKCLWNSNTGLPKTQKIMNANISTEATTSVALQNTYYDIAGTYSVLRSSHFSMPVNGEFELLTGSGLYQVSGYFSLESTQNNTLDIRIVKSVDGGSTFPTEVFHTSGVVNALSGGRDIATIPFTGFVFLEKGDRIKFQTENKSGTADITAELGSYINIKLA